MSWVEYKADSPFPIQNLPFGVFKRTGATQAHIGVGIGQHALDLNVLAEAGIFTGEVADTLKQPLLNDFMGLGRKVWREVRAQVTDLLKTGGNAAVSGNAELKAKALVALAEVEMVLPARIGDYTDFYSSRFHATNVGIMFRGKDNALQPNWLHLPVGYHGRASSVVVSGTPIRRPCGQKLPPGGASVKGVQPVFGQCNLLDFELEMAAWVGTSTKLGERVTIDNAEDAIFGLSLMNDWSARDIQKWEYVPLGPFNGKNFATSISPWIVSLDALEPFKCQSPWPQEDPTPLPYLQDKHHNSYDVKLSVGIKPEGAKEATTVCETNCKNLYWSFKQQLVHHSVTGCPFNSGDLFGSGTISGENPGSFGSMLEIAWKGTKPFAMPDGSERKFIKDGDEVVMDGFCQGDGYRIGFGPCNGVVMPAQL